VQCALGCFGNSVWAITCVVSAVGSGNEMAKVIEFYVPETFRKTGKWIPPTQRGKVIQFPLPEKKTA